jgi:hypothetical protein
MKVRIVKSAVIHGFVGVQVGDVVEMSDRQASEVIGAGLAKQFSGEEEKTETRVPEIESRDPQPAKKRSKSNLP